MPHILGSSVSYRIAIDPQQGRKAFMIRTIRSLDRPDPGLERVRYTGQTRQRREANPEPQISKDATEKPVVRTVACYRSGINKYELSDHSHRQTFSEADRLALIFLAAVTRIDEAIFSQ